MPRSSSVSAKLAHSSKPQSAVEPAPSKRTTISVPTLHLQHLKIVCVIEDKPLKWGVSRAIAEFVQRNFRGVPGLTPAAAVGPTKSPTAPSAKKTTRPKDRPSTAPNTSGTAQEPHQAQATLPRLL
jgi:hypothetical protein